MPCVIHYDYVRETVGQDSEGQYLGPLVKSLTD